MLSLTIVTATFNAVESGRAKMLERCIRSVVALKTPHEHLIYDGASKDGAVAILRRLERECPGLSVVSEPDSGIYNALNKGVRAAKGKWIYVLGDDDFICAPEVMDEVIAEAEMSGALLIASPVQRGDSSDVFWSRTNMRSILTRLPYSHQGVLMRRELMVKMGGFDERFKICADFNLCLRAHFASVPFKPIFKVYAHFEPGGVSTPDDIARHDCMLAVADVFGLNVQQQEIFRRKRLLPMWKIFGWLWHSNWVVRMGARHALKRHVARCLGMLDQNGEPRGFFRRF